MNLPKALLPLLAASASLGGCVYEEVDTGYREPRRVHHGGYVEQEVVVERHPNYYREERPREYYRERPVTVYEDRPQPYYYDDRPRGYGGGYAVIPAHRGESADERQKRELRERQRAHDEHEKKKDDDDHKKKKKKKDKDDN